MSRILLLSLICFTTGICLPQSTEASCGDWLASHPTTTPAEPPKKEAAEVPEQPARRCSGPHCEQAPVVPSPPIPDQTQRDHRDLACLSVVLREVSIEPSRALDFCEITLPGGLLTRIDRPPQA